MTSGWHWKWQKFPIFGSPQNMHLSGSHKSMATSLVPCINGMRRHFCFCWIWKENCLVYMELLPRAYQCSYQAGTSTTCDTRINHDVTENFIVFIYDHTCISNKVNEARKKLFAKTISVWSIPPICAALKQHVKRAVFQGSYGWGQTLLSHPTLPSQATGDGQDWKMECVNHYGPPFQRHPSAVMS